MPKREGTEDELRAMKAQVRRLEAELRREQKAAERRRDATRAAKTTFAGADIVITDPCYVFVEGDQWHEFCDELSLTEPQVMSERWGNTIAASTIYGDWMCELLRHDGDKKTEAVGTFTADSGTVCVTELTPAAKESLKHVARNCWTSVPNFTGTARIVHRRGVCHVELNGTSNGNRYRYWSRQIAG